MCDQFCDLWTTVEVSGYHRPKAGGEGRPMVGEVSKNGELD